MTTQVDWNMSLIRDALDDLKRARNRLRSGNAPHAAAYVARALKSAEGALRHQQGKRWRPASCDQGYAELRAEKLKANAR